MLEVYTIPIGIDPISPVLHFSVIFSTQTPQHKYTYYNIPI